MKILLICILTLLLSAAARPGFTQRGSPPPIPPDPVVVHLDAPPVPAKNAYTARLELRAFSGDEKAVYGGASAQYGLGNGRAVLLRIGVGGKKSRAVSEGGTVRYGGSDVEIVAKSALLNSDRLSVLMGIGLPNTPAQSDPVFTLGLTAAMPVNRSGNITVYLNPRAALIKGNTLFGMGIGARATLTPGIALTLDWTRILAGDNTRDTTDGSRKRVGIYGIAFRFASRSRNIAGFDIGYTTALGPTTALGLTPGLAGSGAFFTAVTFRH